MNLDRVDSGRDVPNDVNVVIEIPMSGDPIKYELDKATGALFIDRFLRPDPAFHLHPFPRFQILVMLEKMRDLAGGEFRQIAH